MFSNKTVALKDRSGSVYDNTYRDMESWYPDGWSYSQDEDS